MLRFLCVEIFVFGIGSLAECAGLEKVGRLRLQRPCNVLDVADRNSQPYQSAQDEPRPALRHEPDCGCPSCCLDISHAVEEKIMEETA
jgi:hypothetical protein